MNKDNPNLQQLIHDLRHVSTQQKVKVWKTIALKLSRPTRAHAEVNLDKLEKYVHAYETAIVPGKVLSSGVLTKKITIAAWNFSEKAKEKILKAGGKPITIQEVIKQNPKGSKVRIIA